MALTKVSGDFIQDGSITQGHLHASHGITTSDIGEGSNLYFTTARVNTAVGNLSTSDLSEGINLYYTDARVGSYLTTNSYATQSYVNTQVSNLVDSAPSTLDTLNELAAALGDDANFSTTVTNSIATKLPLAGGTLTGALSGTSAAFSGNVTGANLNISNWDTAYGWGNHASVGYLTSYTETDTLATVTGRGASTSTESIFTGNLRARKSQTAGNYTTAALWTESFNSTPTGIAFHISGNVGKFLEMRTNGTLYWDGSTVWHSGNDGPGTGLDADTLDGSHASSFWTKSGSWYGDLGSYSYTREIGLTMTGGSEFVVLSKSGQGSVLVDGHYMAYESNNGFFGSYNSTYGNLTGIRATAANTLKVMQLDGGNAILEVTQDARAPIFYDSNNTARYIDPTNLSVLYQIQSTQAQASPRWDTAFYVLQAQHWYGDTGSQVMYLGESGNKTRVRGSMTIGGDFNAQSGYDLSVAGSVHMNNDDINYVNQLHFNDNVRFYDDGNDNYLNFKYADGNYGAIKFYNGGGTLKGYFYSDNDGIGILPPDGSWGVRVTNSLVEAYHQHRAPIYYDSNNTAYYADPASTSILNYTQIYNLYDAQGTRFTNPEGGVHFTSSSSQTGMIRIKLPSSKRNSNTMMQMTINVYQYNTGKSFTIRCGGYNYTTGQWYNTFAHMITDQGISTLNVRFGDDGTYNWIAIGETNSTWDYCQVMITDFQGGYSGTTSAWGYGWDIDFVTSVPSGHNETRATSLALTSNNVSNWGTDLYAPAYYDVNNTNYYVNPNGTSAIRKTNIYAIGSGWDDGLNLYSSDASNRWNVLVDNGTGDYFRIAYNNSEKFRIQTDGEVFTIGTGKAGGDYRAPIFYDSNDTTYYSDPHNVSWVNAVTATRVGVNPSGSNGTRYGISLYGGYSSGEPTYGLLFTGTSLGTHGGVTGNWATYFTMNNDTTRGWIFRRVGSGNAASISGGGLAQFNDSVRSPIFYDSGNTGYYVDPASWSNLSSGRVGSYLQIGTTGNTTHTPGINMGIGSDIYWRQSTYSSNADIWMESVDNATYLTWKLRVSSFDTTSWTDSIVVFNHNFWRGYVGILRSPEYPLDLNGQARLSGGYTTSDIRLKKNIRDNELGLSHLLQLRTRLFDWITDEEILGRTLAFQNSLLDCRGFIAQEVEEVVPELVDTSEGDQPTKSIDDGAVTAMMVKAIQEQQAIIDDLKARIEILENQ